MKKLLFILAAAALLVACNNNENEPENPNPEKPQQQDTAVVFEENFLYDQFKEILPLQGMALTNFVGGLVNAGWTEYESTGIYVKSTDNTASQVSYKTNSDDVVYEVTLNITPTKSGDKYEADMTTAFVKDVILKIGTNCTMGAGAIDCRYLCAYTNIGQRYTVNPDDFNKTFSENNLNAVAVYYLDTRIENWVKAVESGQTQAPFTGVEISYRTAAPIDGSSVAEFSMNFRFTDETSAE